MKTALHWFMGITLFLQTVTAYAMETIALEINNQSFVLEVPLREQELMQGLMFRHFLAKKHGMLFLFDPERKRRVTMWMKNTYLSLDMLFIDSNDVIVCTIEKTRPLSMELIDCGPGIAAVIELNAGEIKQYGLARGMKLHASTSHFEN